MGDSSLEPLVLNKLSALAKLRAKAIFAAEGLYYGEDLLGILFENGVYFKMDHLTRVL